MKPYSLKQFNKTFADTKVFYDKAFQRRVVWEAQHINKYVESLTKTWALQAIVVADAEACKEYCMEKGHMSSVEYFKKVLSEGFKYISLDGQNRTKNLLRLLANEVTVTGMFEDADGETQKIQNSFFKHMPLRLQDHLKSGCRVTIQIVESATKDDLSCIFQALNSGTPLNEQELRQATKTPIAEWVRETSLARNAMLQRTTNSKRMKRMEDDENIAKMAMTLMRRYNHPTVTSPKEWGLTSHDIDQWYEMGLQYYTLDDSSCPYIKKEVERVEEILLQIAMVLTHQKTIPPSRLIPKRLWWAVTQACEWAHDNNFEIQNNSAFFTELKALDDQLAIDSETEFSLARAQLIAKGEDPDTVSYENYYHRWAQLPHQAPQRKKRKRALVDAMRKNLNKLTLRKKFQAIQAAA